MPNRTRSTLAALGAAAVLTTACADQPTPTAVAADVEAASLARGGNARTLDGAVYEAILKPLNARTTARAATGKAVFTIDGNTFTASTHVRGVLPNEVHQQHIHGFLDGQTAVCPTPQADADGDGLVELLEAFPSYGNILVPLDSDLSAAGPGEYPLPPDWTISYGESTALENVLPAVEELDKRVVVVHGALVDGTYNGFLPIACGEIRRVR